MPKRWHLITGEYPPQPGGVSDYTQLVAEGLAHREAEVHVWCPPAERVPVAGNGVFIHRICGRFSPGHLRQLGRELTSFPAPRTLLVQYAANAYQKRGCNLPFCLWLWKRSKLGGDDLRIMFHEAYFYFTREKPRQNVLAVMQRLMALVLLSAARQVYISTSAWEPLLRPFALGRKVSITTLPIPSLLEPFADLKADAGLRLRITGGKQDRLIIGHFGTYGGHIAPLVCELIARLSVKLPAAIFLLLGRGSMEMSAAIRQTTSAAASRVVGAGNLPGPELAAHLKICDLMIQPFPEGVTTRRTSIMAPLCLGVPVCTTRGRITEPTWSESAPVALARAGDPGEFMAQVAKLCDDPSGRNALGRRGRDFYWSHASLEHTLSVLAQ